MAINALRVIDLTRPAEPNVGKRLADDIPLWSSIGRVGVSSTYDRIGSTAALRHLINRVVSHCETQHEVPILHFEAHGSTKAIRIGEADSLSWMAFLELLRTVNVATRNNLLVTMAACKSAWLTLSVAPDKPCPFCLLIAPIDDVSVGEVEGGFQDFYRTLLANYDMNGCLTALNARVVSSENAFVAVDAEELFRDVARAYIEKHCTGKARQRRLERLVSRAVDAGLTTETPLRDVRKNFRRQLQADPETSLRANFETFMMIDRFPENKQRFVFDIESGT